ncbi:MAG TPA: GTP pyrophosphokinase family protein [Candidatus Avipropionibacterium avicola]|uniref:GTP pyrophosphokinase family protein n=1 Tax=Candidatus Avipropionibacterium avicola TaxID=2840701 RepID=A0A9D1H059_9ACTN|nr:GTP pyrophosphokinase family protein [Candidatus Avipropionibacterium avicola]
MATPEEQDLEGQLATMRRIRDEFGRVMLSYRFAMQEVRSKVEVLRQEYQELSTYNPIEHISSRLKSAESVVDKVLRKGLPRTMDSVRSIPDIAGVRVTCSFISDTYAIFEALTGQPDIAVITVKDYIDNPKPNGYRSLHAVVEVPVFLSTGAVRVPVEVQLRTVAMDAWASLEHKIFYKYRGEVPQDVIRRLGVAAEAADKLDREMEDLHEIVHGPRGEPDPAPLDPAVSDEVVRRLLDLFPGGRESAQTSNP